METKWTPGPWVKDRLDQLRAPDGRQVGVWGAGMAWVSRDDEAEANAKLIAAAPDLYSALERLQRNFALLLSGKPVRDVAETEAEVNAALRKAHGEALPITSPAVRS